MFLKLFSRYAERAHQGATVAGDNLRGTVVVVENAPKSLSRHDGASVIRACRQRCDELVAETLTYRKIKISFLRDFGNESVAIGLHAIAEVLQ